MTAFAVFASGEGSNLQRFIDESRAGSFPGTLALVVSDHPGCRAIDRARHAAIDACAFAPKSFADKAAYERAILAELQSRGVEWLVLAGYMRLLGPTLLVPYRGRIVNVHPSLLPQFPGKDAIGQAIHAGVNRTGVTVHLVDEGMDTGPAIAQAPVTILPNDTPESLAERIHAVEHQLYPAVVRNLLQSNADRPLALFES